MLTDPLIIASCNEGKVREIQLKLTPFCKKIISQKKLGLDEIEETGLSFEANARLKANYVFSATGMPALSDDSGLCVEALDGAPGIYSARWAGKEKDFLKASKKIEAALIETEKNPPFYAYFVCVLALATKQGVSLYRGETKGQLVFPPRGQNGFGYDPIFQPHHYQKTFGEMSAEEKEALSHRTKAFIKLKEAWLGDKNPSKTRLTNKA